MIDEVSIEIGGQTIDKHYGEWLTIWNELTQTSEKANGYDAMIGQVSSLTDNASAETTPAYTLYVPLQFWFCRNAGLALPLIALQYHEVKFNITFRPVTQCYTLSAGSISPATPSLTNASLYVDYIYLDTDERRQFAQVQHKILCVAKRSLKDFVSENANSIFAILINCGNLLNIFTTILYNYYKRTRLKIVPKGKNVNIWTIRIHFSKLKKIEKNNLILIIKMGYIYYITFPSGKSYIGQTSQDYNQRIRQHKSSNDKSRAFKKYDTYKLEILYNLLDEYEIKFIELYDTVSPNGYNLRTGGQNVYVFSEETRQKCSESQRKTNNNLPMYIYDYDRGYRCRPPGKPEKYFNNKNISKDLNLLLAKEYIEGKDLLYKKHIITLPKYISKVERKDRSGYRCTLPGYEKHFTSMKQTDSEKLLLAKNYLELIMKSGSTTTY